MINWTEVLYTDYKILIQNNGKFSEEIPIQRSVHQGGVNSVYLFLCVAEVLALSLRNNPEISGIPVNDIINLLNQYADDMDVASEYSQKSINAIMSTLEKFHDHTGFTINYDKTKLYRIGSAKRSNATLITQRQIAWTEEPLNILGILVGNDDEKDIENNYIPLITKIEKIITCWETRDLSLLGKILVINTLVALQFVYKMTVLPTIPEHVVSRIEQLIVKYLWNGKKAKISLSVLQRSGTEGGVKLIDLRLRDMSLKISWAKILSEDESMANLAYYFLENDMKQWIFDCNLHPKDVDTLEINNSFWSDMLKAWCTLNYTEEAEIDHILWYNSKIRIQNRVVFWKHAFLKGLFRVSQLYQGGNLKPIDVITREFGLSLMEYNGIISAIPVQIRNCVRNNQCKPHTSLFSELIDKKNIVQHVYNQLLKKKDDGKIRAIKEKWEQRLGVQIILEDFYKSVALMYKTTNVPKLRSFQYRLLMNAIVTNKNLKLWKIKDTDLCSFCCREVETELHLFCGCDMVKALWVEVREIINIYDNSAPPIIFDPFNILCNTIHAKPTHIANFICLLTKQYIYKQRCIGQTISKRGLRAQIYMYENIEKYLATKSNKIEKHNAKWYPETKEFWFS